MRSTGSRTVFWAGIADEGGLVLGELACATRVGACAWTTGVVFALVFSEVSHAVASSVIATLMASIAHSRLIFFICGATSKNSNQVQLRSELMVRRLQALGVISKTIKIQAACSPSTEGKRPCQG